MRLAEAGAIELDAPVASQVRRWRPPECTAPFTARQLMSNTAGVGLGDYAARYAPGALRPELPAFVAQDFALAARPGGGFLYARTASATWAAA